LGMWAYHFPKIGVSFMPALDEGTTLDMPITVPRVGVTQSADDLKHRDGLLRGFPEVESVIGKSGRADTPTDPAPLDMFETLVNFRPRELWPKRVLHFDDAAQQTRDVLRALEARGFARRAPNEDDRDGLINDAAQKALERAETLGAEHRTFADEVLQVLESRRMALWRERVHEINWELLDRGTEAFTWYAIEELLKGASALSLVAGAPQAEVAERFSGEA